MAQINFTIRSRKFGINMPFQDYSQYQLTDVGEIELRFRSEILKQITNNRKKDTHTLLKCFQMLTFLFSFHDRLKPLLLMQESDQINLYR